MLQSGIFLEEEVKAFCVRNNIDEGVLWQKINNRHTIDYNRNIMWEKKQEEDKEGCGDIPMAQAFAKAQLVGNVFFILKGFQTCIDNNWEVE